MRVGLICPYSLTIPGGVQGQVLALARTLRVLGHDTRVLGPCDGPPPDAGVTPLGNSVPAAANGSVAPLAPDPSAQLRTIRALRDESFDVLHVHEPMCPGPTMTSLLFKSSPLVGTFHAAGVSAGYRWLKPGPRLLANRLDLRCAVSEDARRLAATALGGEYTMVFNGVEIEQFATAKPWPTDGPTILFVGRHEPRKGLEVLLEAFADLPTDVRLWIGSDGPETARLQARFAGDPRIEWLGRISDAEKASRLRSAHVFCAPSLRGESFGVVLLEAMAARTAVVASDIPGYRNVARPDVEALMATPGDAQSFRHALRRLLDDPDRRAELADAGERRTAQFSMLGLAERFVPVYESAVACAPVDRRS